MSIIHVLIFQILAFGIPDQPYADALSYFPEHGYKAITCRMNPDRALKDAPQYVKKDLAQRRPTPFDLLLTLDGENFRYYLCAWLVEHKYVELSSPIYTDDFGEALSRIQEKSPYANYPVWHYPGEQQDACIVGYYASTYQHCYVLSIIDSRVCLTHKYNEGTIDRLDVSLFKQPVYSYKHRTKSEDRLYLCAVEPDLIIAAENLPMLRRMAAAGRGEDPGFLSQVDYLAAFEHISDNAVYFHISFQFEQNAVYQDHARRSHSKDEKRMEQLIEYGSGKLYGLSWLTVDKELVEWRVQCFAAEEFARESYDRYMSPDSFNDPRRSEETKHAIRVQRQNTDVELDGCFVRYKKLIDKDLINAVTVAQEQAEKEEAEKQQRKR